MDLFLVHLKVIRIGMGCGDGEALQGSSRRLWEDYAFWAKLEAADTGSPLGIQQHLHLGQDGMERLKNTPCGHP